VHHLSLRGQTGQRRATGQSACRWRAAPRAARHVRHLRGCLWRLTRRACHHARAHIVSRMVCRQTHGHGALGRRIVQWNGREEERATDGPAALQRRSFRQGLRRQALCVRCFRPGRSGRRIVRDAPRDPTPGGARRHRRIVGSRHERFAGGGHTPHRAQGNAARSPSRIPPFVDGRKRGSRDSRASVHDAARRGHSHRARSVRVGDRRVSLSGRGAGAQGESLAADRAGGPDARVRTR
jgi:hypothetical protein